MQRAGFAAILPVMTLAKPLDSGAPAASSGAAGQTALARASSPWPFRPLLVVGFLVAYVLLEWVSFIHEYKGVPITPWNPGLGVVFALMIYAGPRYGAVLLAGVVIAELAVLRTNLEWWVLIAIAAIISLGYGAAAAVARRNLRLDIRLDHLRDIAALLAAGLGGAVVVAALLPLLLLAAGQLDRGDVPVALPPFLVGDFIGITVMAPLTLRLVLREGLVHARALLPALPELLSWAAIVTVLLWIIVDPAISARFNYFYLVFVPVVIAAARHGLDGACVSLAVTQLVLVGLLHYYGHDAAAFTEVQMLMLVLTATGLVVGVTVSESRQAQRATRAVEDLLRKREAEAAAAARVNLVSGMASALAHEINQPMTAARALARAVQQILRLPNADLPRAEQNLATLVAQIDHAGGVVRRMRDFLRRGEPRVSTIDVRSLLNDTVSLLAAAPTIGRSRIDIDVPERMPPLHADRVQLQQVVLNLVHNALDAIGPERADGRITVSARRLEQPARIEFRIADNGPGIDQEVVGRLFEPLITSKREGLGLGLSISASIVESHGGRLWLESTSPRGTEFRFSLPLESAQI
jgi:signal transduction histidine kinase